MTFSWGPLGADHLAGDVCPTTIFDGVAGCVLEEGIPKFVVSFEFSVNSPQERYQALLFLFWLRLFLR